MNRTGESDGFDYSERERVFLLQADNLPARSSYLLRKKSEAQREVWIEGVALRRASHRKTICAPEHRYGQVFKIMGSEEIRRDPFPGRVYENLREELFMMYGLWALHRTY